MHRDVVMGYYNGGHLVRLDVDIASTPPSTDPAIAAVAAWLHHHGGLPATCKWKPSGVQITISTEHLTGGDPLAARIAALPELRNGSLRLTRSAHSIDVVVASASKLRVVAELEAGIAPRHQVLTIGDSGARAGNDCELLSRSSGISVGAVCGRLGGSHSLFGRWTRGPEALVNVLMSIKRSTKGEMRLSLDAPALDKLDR